MAESGGETPLEVLLRVLGGYRCCHFEKGLSVYGVVEKKSGNLIGAAGFNIGDSLNMVELLYHSEKGSWGKGYATEAVRDCIELAEKHSEIETIFASAAPSNESSI